MDNLLENFVGVVVEVIQIDYKILTGLDTPHIIYLTNNAPSVTFDSNTYIFTPIEISGVASSVSGGNSRPQLNIGVIGNRDEDGALIPSPIVTAILSTGDLVGATVRRFRTFEQYLDKNTEGSESYQEEVWKISQITSLTRTHVSFSLISEIDSPDSRLGRKVMLQNEFPGLLG